MRVVLRIGCWLLALIGGLTVAMFGAVALTDDRSDARLGGVVLAVVGLALLAVGIYGLRRTRRVEEPLTDEPTAPSPTPPSPALMDAYARVRAGEPIVLRPSRRRWAFLLVGFVVFTAISAFAFADTLSPVFAVGVLLFGAGLVLGVFQLIPGQAYLRIARDGLLVRTPLKTTRWAWNDIEQFRAYEIYHRYGSVKQVGFDRRDLTPDRQGFWQTVGRGMSGVDGALPDTYGFEHHDLATVLNAARETYATEHGLSESAKADLELEAQAARVPQDRVPAVTIAVTLACLAAFVVEASRYGLFPDATELVAAGGVSRDALADGDWWTLLSANLLHANPIHLLFNLFGFVALGMLLEREVGWLRFGALCLVGGIASMGLAVLLQGGTVTVGLSGVVFAVSGWAIMRDTHRTRALGVVAWATVPIGVIYTFLAPGVSIGAHVGGLLAGLAFGYVYERRGARRTRPPSAARRGTNAPSARSAAGPAKGAAPSPPGVRSASVSATFAAAPCGRVRCCFPVREETRHWTRSRGRRAPRRRGSPGRRRSDR